MALSHDLISQFAKVINNDKKAKSESTSYGTTVEYNGSTYVKLDGSDLLTPVETTADTKAGERVTVLIKDHTATVTGNLSSPAARKGDVQENHDKIAEFDNVMAYKVTTENIEAVNATIENLKAKVASYSSMTAVVADIETLQSKFASLDKVNAQDVDALNAEIENIKSKFGEFTEISTEDLEAMNADIATLKSYTASFTYVSAERLTAALADIKELDAKKLSAEDASLKYANIDFSNIGKAAIEQFYATSGIIKDLVIGDTSVTGKLVGVTIVGDLIEGGTVKADKLVVLGEDGLYYKLNTNGVTTTAEQTEYNSLNGSVITAKTITAEKVKVDDLVAFDATIGGFNITNSSIYSGAKESVTNTTRGIYLDKNGQISFGDADNYIRYYKMSDGTYKLEISADSISIKSGSVSTSLNDALDDINNKVSNCEVAIEQNRSALEIRATKKEVLDAVAKASSDLENTISDEYVNKNNYATDKDTTSKRIEGVEKHAEDNTKAISDSTKSADDKISNLSKTLSKYFKFDTNGLTIGSGENSLKLVLDNNEIGFFKNNQKIAWWDGNYLHTGNIEVATNERAQFGNFAFIPRSDGSLMFLKVSDTEVSN